MDIIKEVAGDLRIRIHGTPEEPLFVAKDISKLLGKDNPRKLLSSFNETEKIKIAIVDSMGRTQSTSALNIRGVWRMIAASRTLVAEDLRQRLNHRYGYYYTVPELDFISKIKTIFSTETFESQKQVLNYRIDLYMPRYNLAIEFDESRHRWHQEYDRTREEQIIEQLGCTFIRVKDTTDICIAAGQIYSCIRR